MNIRLYNPETDYEGIKLLYLAPNTFGGQFDVARDTPERLAALIERKPESVLIAEFENKIIGSVTLFEDGRSAWLYRFAVLNEHDAAVSPLLWKKAKEIMKDWGHDEVLVYAPAGNQNFENRYTNIGFNKGGDYTCYWQSTE